MNEKNEILESLRAHNTPISPFETMAEAGRKAMLKDFIAILEHEAGSRTGDDIEDVHDMRVATRRLRSALRLLSEFYDPAVIRPLNRGLREVAQALGTVRDLDVMIDNLTRYHENRSVEEQAAIQEIIAYWRQEQQAARVVLNELLDKKRYRRLIKDVSEFLITEGKGAASMSSPNGTIHPTQVRHLLPSLVYGLLEAVRAYDTVIETADSPTLHALRIEFKRLRYALSFFESLLGTDIKPFQIELKVIQDHLGELNDASVAQERLADTLTHLSADGAMVLQGYIDTQVALHANLKESFPAVWKRFNTKTVQRKLAMAIASL